MSEKRLNVKVLKTFTDKHTNEKHKKGDRLTITEDRFREILCSGAFVEVENVAPSGTVAKTGEIKK